MSETVAHLIVNLAEVDAEDGLDLVGELDQSVLDLSNWEQLEPSGGLRYDLSIQRIEDELLVRGRVDLTCSCVCSLCGVTFKTTYSDPDYCESHDISAINEEFDLTESLRESIILSLPTYPVCKQDCLGLCYKCGVNLNTSACTCDQQGGDSCWSELDKLSSSGE